MEEKIRKEWEETKMKQNLNPDIQSITEGDKLTSLQNLARRYKWFSNISMLCILWVPLMMLTNFIPNGWRVWIVASFGVYFLTCSIMDRWLYYGITGINMACMGVDEVYAKAMYYRKRHLQFVVILLPMAFIVIGLFAYATMGNDKSMLIGIITGSLFGLAIGTRQLMAFMKDYRKLTE